MGFDQSKFDELAAKYGWCSSWAVWDPAYPEDAAIIANHVAELKTSVVLVALNISREIRNDWQNFHGHLGEHARKLMYAFNESPYRGAYMTDLIKGEVEPNADRLMAKVRSGKIDLCKHVNAFNAEMSHVGVHKHSLFILFGDKVEKLFRLADLHTVYLNHVRCTHYSYTGYTDPEWVEETWSKLQAHFRATEARSNTLPFFRNEAMVARLQAPKAQQEPRKEGQSPEGRPKNKGNMQGVKIDREIKAIVESCPRLDCHVNKGERHRIMRSDIESGGLWVTPRARGYNVTLTGEVATLMYPFLCNRFGKETGEGRYKWWDIQNIKDLAEIIRHFDKA